MLWLVLFFALALLGFLALCWRYAYDMLHIPRQQPRLTPSELGLDADPVEFAARDGVRLRGWWLAAPQARGSIIFSHGYRGDCSTDLVYAAWLTRAGYNLLLYDNRGHGRSDGTFTTLGYYETRDLLGAIDFLQARGITRVGVLGFSMGGSVALQTAPLTDAIAGVVADCTFASLRTLLTHHAPAFHIPRLLAPFAGGTVVALASLQARANLFEHSPVHCIGRIAPRPVLLIQAGHDELVPASETERLYAAARSPKELWLVENAGHRSVDQLVREEYEQRVRAFFDLCLGSDGPEILPVDQLTSPVVLNAGQ